MSGNYNRQPTSLASAPIEYFTAFYSGWQDAENGHGFSEFYELMNTQQQQAYEEGRLVFLNIKSVRLYPPNWCGDRSVARYVEEIFGRSVRLVGMSIPVHFDGQLN